MSKITKKPMRAEAKQKRQYSAKMKCEAVLAVWSERRKPAEVCRELGIQWGNLSQWQNRALEAMMAALEPRGKSEEERGPSLGPKLEKLLERTQQRVSRLSKLEKRLEKIQVTGVNPTSNASGKS